MAAASQSKIEEPRPTTAATEIKIRDAIEADLPAIVEIHNAAIASGISTAQLEPVTVEGRREWLRAHSPAQYPIWVAELDGTIAGWLSLREFLPRCAYRGTVEVSVFQIGVLELAMTQIAMPQVSPTQVGIRQVCPAKVRIAQIRRVKTAASKFRLV